MKPVRYRSSKSPKAVMAEAMAVAREKLPAYAHRFSPRKFTQHQLFALLVLKTLLRLDYRGLVALLNDAAELREAIGLSAVPHYTTLQKAAARLTADGKCQLLLDGTVERARKKAGPVGTAAADSTGFDTSRASRYFVRRRNHSTKAEELLSYRTFPKLELVVDTATHLVLHALATVGPMVDVASFRRLLFGTLRRAGVTTVLADAGYDSESNHRFARDGCGVVSVIPATHGRRTDKLPPTPHRRRMKRGLGRRYGQRWQVETVVSMLKRNYGSFVAARTPTTRDADVMLRVGRVRLGGPSSSLHQASIRPSLVGWPRERTATSTKPCRIVHPVAAPAMEARPSPTVRARGVPVLHRVVVHVIDMTQVVVAVLHAVFPKPPLPHPSTPVAATGGRSF